MQLRGDLRVCPPCGGKLGNFQFAWAEAAIIRLCCAVQNGLRCRISGKTSGRRAPRSAVCSANGRYNPSGTARVHAVSNSRRAASVRPRRFSAQASWICRYKDARFVCRLSFSALQASLRASSFVYAPAVSKTSFCTVRSMGSTGTRNDASASGDINHSSASAFPRCASSHAAHRSSVRSSRNCRFPFSVCRSRSSPASGALPRNCASRRAVNSAVSRMLYWPRASAASRDRWQPISASVSLPRSRSVSHCMECSAPLPWPSVTL